MPTRGLRDAGDHINVLKDRESIAITTGFRKTESTSNLKRLGLRAEPAFQKSELSLDYSANQNYILISPCRHEGRFAIVTKRGAGCDGRVRRQRGANRAGENAAAYGEVVWSWRRDRGVYPPSPVAGAATVTINAAHRGEHV